MYKMSTFRSKLCLYTYPRYIIEFRLLEIGDGLEIWFQVCVTSSHQGIPVVKQFPLSCTLHSGVSCTAVSGTFLHRTFHVDHAVKQDSDIQSWQWFLLVFSVAVDHSRSIRLLESFLTPGAKECSNLHPLISSLKACFYLVKLIPLPHGKLGPDLY